MHVSAESRRNVQLVFGIRYQLLANIYILLIIPVQW
jgi:hypothetical protein